MRTKSWCPPPEYTGGKCIQKNDYVVVFTRQYLIENTKPLGASLFM